jgi:hypothetical protein
MPAGSDEAQLRAEEAGLDGEPLGLLGLPVEVDVGDLADLAVGTMEVLATPLLNVLDGGHALLLSLCRLRLLARGLPDHSERDTGGDEWQRARTARLIQASRGTGAGPGHRWNHQDPGHGEAAGTAADAARVAVGARGSWPHGVEMVIAGGGFGGFFTARTLEKVLPPTAARVTLVTT